MFQKIPGFRSGRTINKIIAIIGYIFFIIVFFVAGRDQPTIWDRLSDKLFGIIVFFGILIPLANLFQIRQKFFLFNRKSIPGKIFGYIGYILLCFILLGLVSETQSAQAKELRAERIANQDADRKVAAAVKKQAEDEAKAKKEADEKAKAEAKAKADADMMVKKEQEEKAKVEAKAKVNADTMAKKEQEDKAKADASDKIKTISYLETSANKEENQKISDQYKGKSLKWSARLSIMTGWNNTITLQEPGLATIQARFKKDIVTDLINSNIKPGQIITVSGKLNKYVISLGEWDFEDCSIEPANEETIKAIEKYENDYKEKQKIADPNIKITSRASVEKYVGLEGYAVSSVSDLGYSDTHKTPWTVKVLKQVGDNKFEKTNETINHKTKVKVIDQNVISIGWGMHEGALLIETLEGEKKTVWIDIYNFLQDDYWNQKDPLQAAKEGLYIASYNGQGEKPVDRDNKWVEDIEPGTRVYVTGWDNYNKRSVKGKVTKQWKKYGYGELDVYFDPASLQIEY